MPAEEQDAIAAQILGALDADAVAAFREGIAAEEQGRVRPAREALKELGQRLGMEER